MAFVKSGWLLRQSTILKRWKKNWFDLWSDGHLIYYDDQTRQSIEDKVHMPVDCINIRTGHECRDIQPPDGKPKECMLQIVCRDGKTISLCAESTDDCLAWKFTLQDSRINTAYVGSEVLYDETTVASSPPPYTAYATPTPPQKKPIAMHRTYSLRSQRAPTAAQLQLPPPPPSSTKSRFFGKGSLSHNLRKSAAGAMGPELARKLAQLVKMEKNLMRSIEITSGERKDVAKQLSLWGEGNDDDISDITDKLGVLIYEIGELEDQFIDRYDQYRITIKSIRDIEGSVQPSRDRKQKITDQIAYLKYKDPQSPKINVLEQELVRAEAESLVAEAQLSNITREKLKTAFNYQFDSIREHAEKIALIAGYGKALLELLDESPVTPGETRPAYDGYEASKQIIIDAENALASWTFDSAVVRPTLSLAAHDDYDADDLAEDTENMHVTEQEWENDAKVAA